MKLEVGQCACSRRGTVYCRKPEGYRFTGKKCAELGEKIKAGK